MPPNRSIYATAAMAGEGYLSPNHPGSVEPGELYTLLFGDLVLLGYDSETGASTSLTEGQAEESMRYFERISPAGSGAFEAMMIRARAYDGDGHDGRASRAPGDALPEARDGMDALERTTEHMDVESLRAEEAPYLGRDL